MWRRSLCSEITVRDDVRIIGAFVVPKTGATPAADAIRAFAAERLAAYKCPREVRFIEVLPRTPNGKVKRSALAKLIPPRAPAADLTPECDAGGLARPRQIGW